MGWCSHSRLSMTLLPRLTYFLLAAGVLVSAGCVSRPEPATVSLSVVSLRPLQSTVLETNVEVTLRLTNESGRQLALAGSAHRLYVNDSLVGRAVSAEAVTVPAFGTATPVVTLRLENLALLRKAAEFSRAPGRLAYRLESRLQPTDGGFFSDLKVTTVGELDLAGLGLLPPVPR